MTQGLIKQSDARHADAEVAVGELVWDVEAERPELAALDGHAVEHCEREQQQSERVVLHRRIKSTVDYISELIL